MFKGKRILAVIPARGGSKGLPGKNIRNLAEKPLVSWTIDAAKGSQYIDTVTVNTDSIEIAEVARKYGAQVPFLRPAELATDSASSYDVIIHALNWHAEQEILFDLVMLLQPTSPLRTVHDIDRAIEIFFEKKAQAIVSVCPCDHHPWWANTLPNSGNMEKFLRPEVLQTNRQGLPPHYRLNGAIYLADIDFLRLNGSFFGSKTFALTMSKKHSVDIDDIIDFQLAEFFLDSSRGPI